MGKHHEACVQLVLGLGFGDEGKGSLVDWLARTHQTRWPDSPLPMVVRWNGGAQAAHHVHTRAGLRHCFAQFGSHSLLPSSSAETFLGANVIVDPYALVREAEVLAPKARGAVFERLWLDPNAVFVTPWHAVLNRCREALRGAQRHGSTGRGIGEARFQAEGGQAPVLRAAALHQGPASWGPKLHELRDYQLALLDGLSPVQPTQGSELAGWRAKLLDKRLMEHVRAACDALGAQALHCAVPPLEGRCLILESAQGALLDRDEGFFPHVSPAHITRRAAEAVLQYYGLSQQLHCWGVLRAMHTRHGEGPLPSEDSVLSRALPELDNPSDGPSGAFRVGYFDAELARWAMRFAGPVDAWVLSQVDRAEALGIRRFVSRWNVEDKPVSPGDVAQSKRLALAQGAALAWEQTEHASQYLSALEASVEQPIAWLSRGPCAEDKSPRSIGNLKGGCRP